MALSELGLPMATAPEWVRRWERARKQPGRTRHAVDDHRLLVSKADWRVFPEQIVDGPKYQDDPRYTLAEADEIGVMPEGEHA